MCSGYTRWAQWNRKRSNVVFFIYVGKTIRPLHTESVTSNLGTPQKKQRQLNQQATSDAPSEGRGEQAGVPESLAPQLPAP